MGSGATAAITTEGFAASTASCRAGPAFTTFALCAGGFVVTARPLFFLVLQRAFHTHWAKAYMPIKGSAKTDATACAARLIVRFAFAKSPLRRDIPKSLFVFKMEDVCSPLKTMKSRLRNRLFRLRLGI